MISRRSTGIALVVAAVVATLTSGPVGPAAATAAPFPADCRASGSLEQAHFPKHPKVDNRWFPLVPGTRFELSGTVLDGGERHRHRIVTTVTNLTKVLDGVRTVVLLEKDYDNGVIQESELAFMAQSASGRVWNVGEYPEEYVDGRLKGAPSTWISGLGGARAGVGMLAHPRLHTRAYLQGSSPAVEFRDCAKVMKTGQHVCVPVRCYDHVLITQEWDPNDRAGGIQLKYYAPRVGNVRVRALGGDAPENLQLTRLQKLHGHALRQANANALAQDARGYRVSPHLYGRTPRIHHGH
jgi:hypothetical protein